MSAIQQLYFQNMPAHRKPKRERTGPQDNRALRGSDRYNGKRYSISRECTTWGRKMLDAVERARRSGAIVRLFNGEWLVNGKALAV